MQLQTFAGEHIGGPSTAYLPVMVFFVFAILFPMLPLLLGRFLRPWKYQKDKMRPYECGIDPETGAHDRFTVRYSIVAMLFVLFDTEVVFLYPDLRRRDDFPAAVGDHFHGQRLLVHQVCAGRNVCLYRDSGGRLLLRVAEGRPRVGLAFV